MCYKNYSEKVGIRLNLSSEVNSEKLALETAQKN